ncbi:MAG: hypothetical protein WCY82_04320 [Desulfotomaculaceae bacterium]
MKTNTYRITIGGNMPRQYHLQSRRVTAIYIQTYLQLGKQINLELLIDGLWKPVSLTE